MRSGWARFSAKACGAKLHVIYDADADRPIYAAVSAAKVNDITAAQQMPIEAGATYVFDLGDHWAHRCAVEPEKADPLDEYGTVPPAPVVVWGWGSIPDQYGRRSFEDEGEDYDEEE